MACSPQIHSGVPLPQATYTQLIQKGKIVLVLTWSLHPYIPVPYVLEGVQLTKEKRGRQPSHKTCDPQSVLHEKYSRAKVAQKL